MSLISARGVRPRRGLQHRRRRGRARPIVILCRSHSHNLTRNHNRMLPGHSSHRSYLVPLSLQSPLQSPTPVSTVLLCTPTSPLTTHPTPPTSPLSSIRWPTPLHFPRQSRSRRRRSPSLTRSPRRRPQHRPLPALQHPPSW